MKRDASDTWFDAWRGTMRYLFMISVVWMLGFSFYLNQKQGDADRRKYAEYIEMARQYCEKHDSNDCVVGNFSKEASNYAFPKDGRETWRYFYDPLLGAVFYLPLIWVASILIRWGLR